MLMLSTMLSHSSPRDYVSINAINAARAVLIKHKGSFVLSRPIMTLACFHPFFYDILLFLGIEIPDIELPTSSFSEPFHDVFYRYLLVAGFDDEMKSRSKRQHS